MFRSLLRLPRRAVATGGRPRSGLLLIARRIGDGPGDPAECGAGWRFGALLASGVLPARLAPAVG